jgi:thiopeptide-type bacteriocin biosynthesis protein
LDVLSRLPEASFRSPPFDARWLQVNVALARANGDALPSARAMFRELAPFLDQWRLENRLHGWFFMRKPPDVRLRFMLRPDNGDAAGGLENALRTLLDNGRIAGYSPGQYEPEQDRFGGPAAIALVHASFDVDSTLWLVLDELDERGQRLVTPQVLLPARLHHLFLCCCGAERVIEGWRGLARLIRQGGITAAPYSPRLPGTLNALALKEELAASESLALRTYARSNELFSRELLALESKTAVEQPVADIAATVALFSLNRHGFPGEWSAPLVGGVLAALGDDPTRTI